MSALPGARHRTLAPSSVLREGDIAAMEAANAALLGGAHALWSLEIDPLGGRRQSGWAAGDEESIISSAAGQVVRFDLPLAVGDSLAAIVVSSYQFAASDDEESRAVGLYLEVARPREGTVLPLVSNVDDQPIKQWKFRTLGLINAKRGRALGLRLAGSALEVPTLRIVSGAGGDEVQGITVWYQRTPP